MSFVIDTLKALALRGATGDFITVSTSELGTEMGVSQQTISNRLVSMERSGFVKRRRGVHGQSVMITREGNDILLREYSDYRRIFDTPGELRIAGTVASGLGEGQYYLNKPGYRDQISAKLGFVPFNGTLNLKVQDAEMAKLGMAPRSVRIDSFTADGRTYGEAECIPATIRGVRCAIILPKRSHHTGVLEIISAERLRSALKLNDGDMLDIVITQSE